MVQKSILDFLFGDIGINPTKGGTNINSIPKTTPSPTKRVVSKADSSLGKGFTTKSDAAEETLEDSGQGYVGDSGEVSGGGTGTGGSDGGTGSSGGTGGTGSDSGTGSSGTASPLVQGEMTFQELIGEICNGIDLIFICKRSTVVVTDYETLYAEGKYLRDNYHSSVVAEDISLWQLEDGTYELDVNEYGFYNTVIVKYKNGTVKESYEDLVRVYGEVAITYNDKSLDKSSAIMKAKAYLAAHVRDFDMSIKANLLHDADIDIGDIVTLENPMTMKNQYRQDKEKRDPEYLFVMGNSINWDGEGGLLNSIELRYGAKSPEKKEVPETGASYSGGGSGTSSQISSGNIDQAIKEVGQMASKISYSGACQTHDCVQQKQTGDCFGMSDFIACELMSRGVTARIRGYPTSYVSEHRSVQYKDAAGQWVNFPYREYNCNQLFNDTSGVNSSHGVDATCGGNTGGNE